MFDSMKRLLRKSEPWPELFELVSATRSASWSLQW